MLLALASLALAGDLVVTTATPAIVKVDGTPLEYDASGHVVSVHGMSGIHSVEITNMSGKRLAQMNVSVPQDGVTSLAFDGQNLALGSAAGRPGERTSTTVTAGPGSFTVTTESGMSGPKPPPPRPPAPPAGPPPPVPMAPAAFEALVQAEAKASFSSDKVDVVRKAASGNWFTIEQLGRLVDGASFSADKLDIVRACRPKVVDPQNAFALGSHFSFSSDREEAMGMFQ